MLYSARRTQNGVLGAHPSGALKDVSRRVLNQDRREDEGEQFTSLLQLRLPCVRTGVWLIVVMQQEDLIHLPFWPKPSNSMFHLPECLHVLL